MSTFKSSVTFSSGAEGPLSFRFLHYNDIYHITSGSTDPVGGAARFVSAVNHYRDSPEFESLPSLVTFFSGDAFNPSLESSVTKGHHMVPVLNNIKTNIACLGNHDLDFGVDQFRHLAEHCTFPWLCANVEDPAIGDSIAGLKGTCILECAGLKIGVIGLVEKEWLDTLNSIPPNLKFTSAAETAKVMVPKLREDGADIVVCVSHQREPNDMKLAEDIPAGLIDIILGGHDHYYGHSFVNGCHVLRSGCDFKQFSYIEVRRKSEDGSAPGWHFDILRTDITKDIPEDPGTAEIVESLSAGLQAKLGKPIGYTSVPLDARFTTVRSQESNIGNFICDLMRYYYSADCTIMAAGTIRGDQIYPPGILKCFDIVSCFPFEDPVVVIRVSGAQILSALENGISKLPALEGRFPQVSNLFFKYDPSLESGSRIISCRIGDEDLDPHRKYSVATRGYMFRGKDGFTSLTAEAGAEEIVDEENGVLISMIVRQYFLSLKVLGKWRRGGIFRQFFTGLKRRMSQNGELQGNIRSSADGVNDDSDIDDGQADSEEEEDETIYVDAIKSHMTAQEKPHDLAQKMGLKWARLAGVRHDRTAAEVDWTRAISPKVEGRIVDVSK